MITDEKKPAPPLAGAPCPRDGNVCDGVLWCANSVPEIDKRTGREFMNRYYACNKCGCRPADNKRRIPIEYSQRRHH